MKIKKLLKIFGVIIGILLILLIIYFFSIHFYGFINKDSSMTREEVISLLEKGKEYQNYYYSSQDKILFFELDNSSKTEYFIKDNIVKCVSNNDDGNISWTWKDYDNNEIISILEKETGEKYAYTTTLENYEENVNSQRGFDYSLIADEDTFNTDFEYIGEITYESRSTILVKVWNKNDLKINSTIFYIDKETGLIMRRIDYSAFGLTKTDCNRNVKLDIVTDEDIERPDLNQYIVQSF